MDFNINKAARIMRVGNELSEINKKLMEAVYSFIEWIFPILGGQELPGAEFGWIFQKSRENPKLIDVNFKTASNGWLFITTNRNRPEIANIFSFCQALAGDEGEELVAWLENETKKRVQSFEELSSFMGKMGKLGLSKPNGDMEDRSGG